MYVFYIWLYLSQKIGTGLNRDFMEIIMNEVCSIRVKKDMNFNAIANILKKYGATFKLDNRGKLWIQLTKYKESLKKCS